MNRPGILRVRFAVLPVLAVGVFACTISPRAQAQEQSSTGNKAPFQLQVESNLVMVRVVVRDEHGKPVEGLKREDFKIFDRGKEQSITQFEESPGAASSAATGGPASAGAPERYIAFFFDSLNTPAAAMMQARDAADSRLSAILRPTDRVAIFSSDKVLTDFTSDPKRIHDALLQLQGSSTTTIRKMECPNLSDFQAQQILRGNSDALNVAWDEMKSCSPAFSGPQNAGNVGFNDQSVVSIRMLAQRIVDHSEIQTRANLQTLEQLVQYLSRLSGERSITLVSPGFLSVSEQVQLDRIVDQALRAQIVVNALDPKGVAVQMRGAMDRYTASSNASVTQAMQTLDAQAGFVASDVLAELAQGTGGEFVHGSNDLKSGFDALAGHPTIYTIGFAPKNIKLDGNFHALKVTLAKKEKGYNLQARRGYFAVASPAEGAVEAKGPASGKPAQPAKGNAAATAGADSRIFILSVDKDPGNHVAAHAMKDDAPDFSVSNLFLGRSQRVLCDKGYDKFETKFETGVTVEVGAAKRGELAQRACYGVLKWNHDQLAVVPEASQVDIDVLGGDLGWNKPVVAFQVKRSAAEPLMTYQIYSLQKPPQLLRSIAGGGYFNAADVDLQGRASIWTSDAAAISGFDGLPLASFDAPPPVVLRFEHGKLLDVTPEFKAQIDQQIEVLRSQLNAQALQDFLGSDGKLTSSALADAVLSRLRRTKIRVLEMVWAYLYSGRESEAWSELAKSWPAADVERVRALTLTARAHGILSQTDGDATEERSGKRKHAFVFDTIDDAQQQGRVPGLRTTTTDTRPLAILLRLPAPSKAGQSLTAKEEYIDLVVDAEGKVRSSSMFEPSVDEALVRTSAEWKFIPAFKQGNPVACRFRLAVSPYR